jgi:ABC-type branched-subunit amino acid transport system substrate-binding protein/outer membrane protein assembly factor BamD (BamD/ComL family)
MVMKQLFLRCVLLMVLVSASAQVVRSQDRIEYSEKAERIFREGLQRFSAGEYQVAIAAFDRLILLMPYHHRLTASYVMKGKALHRLGDNAEAARVLRTFLIRYPASTYAADAEYTLGLVQLDVKRYDEAVDLLLSAWRRVRKLAGQVKLERHVIEALDFTIRYHQSSSSVRQLLSAATDETERAYLWLKLAEKSVSSGNIAGASVIAETLLVHYPGNQFSTKVTALLANIEQRARVKLGVLLPLLRKTGQSPAKDLGADINDGIVLAVEEYMKDPATRVRVTLEVRDTERDQLTTTRGAQELAGDEGVIGILGPVFSNTTSAAASLANAHGVPLVTPTANSNGIAGIGPYVFQANPDYETRGRIMARYAIQQRGCKRVAVLAPGDSYGKFLAEAFISEALKLGAKIVATEWYQRGTADLKVQFSNIRRAGMLEVADPVIAFGGKLSQADIVKLMQLGVSRKSLDSLVEKSVSISAVQLLGPDAKRLLDSLEITAGVSEPRADSLEYPVTGIDGLYVPIGTPEEIGVVSSQIVYYNFTAQVFGSGEWNAFSELNANRRYASGVIFDADNFPDENDSTYQSFVTRFTERFKRKPSKNTLYGYDLARFVLSLVHNGATSREALRSALQSVADYRGLHSRIDLSARRVNAWLHVLQYSRDEIRRLEEFRLE